MEEKDKKYWLELYEIAIDIQKLEPWKYLWDMDLLTLISPNIDDIVYCSVMGKGGLHKAIGIYFGNAINKFLDMAENDYPSHIAINYQECLMCQLASREHTLPKNRAIIKELGLSFRGEWISFENFEKGYEPSPLNIEQVKLMIEALKNFYMTFRAIIEKGAIADFEHGATLLRTYDEKTKLWNTSLSPLMIPNPKYMRFEVRDKKFKSEVQKLPKKDFEIEYEFLNYMPMRIKGKKGERDFFPRARLIVDRTSGMVMSYDMPNKEDYESEMKYAENSASTIINMIFDIGRPKTIYVRDKESENILMDICSEAGITLKANPKLKGIDKFYKEMERMGI